MKEIRYYLIKKISPIRLSYDKTDPISQTLKEKMLVFYRLRINMRKLLRLWQKHDRLMFSFERNIIIQFIDLLR